MPETISAVPVSQTDRAFKNILSYIKDNELRPGDRLPSEREMAERFSIGRQSVREAIKALSMMNIVEVRKQGGTFVAQPSFNTKYDQFKFYLQSGQISMTEIFETRMIMEMECIALAAEHITAEQLDTIQGAINAVDIDDAEGFAAADRIIHGTIYKATGNRAMEVLMQTVQMWTVVSQGLTNSYREIRQLVHNDHIAIYEALSNRDPDMCRDAMKKHMLHLNQIHYVSDTLMRAELAKLLDN